MKIHPLHLPFGQRYFLLHVAQSLIQASLKSDRPARAIGVVRHVIFARPCSLDGNASLLAEPRCFHVVIVDDAAAE